MQLPYPTTKSTWKLHAIMRRHGKSNPRNPCSNRGPTQKFVSQPSKRLRPYSDSDVSQNLSQNLQELSDLLDNLSKNEELVEQAASLNLNKPALRNTILNKLVSNTNDLKSRTRILKIALRTWSSSQENSA